MEGRPGARADSDWDDSLCQCSVTVTRTELLVTLARHGTVTRTVPGVTPLEGGFPIIENDEVIGGIGVSGVMSHQDAQVAQAGMAAIR